jgi:outer membrane protein TolC
VPAGLPADLIGRRPDLRAAEMRMRANWDTAEAVRTSVYPNIVLTAAGGSSSPALGRLLDHPVGSVLAAVSLPFLDLPRHRLNTSVARVDTELAELGFRTAVYRALGDVDNALSNRTQLMAQRVSLKIGLAASTRAEQLYAVRYRSGSVALRVWLEAQQSLRTARLALDANQLALFENLATLSAALGDGGRDPSDR